MSDSIPAFITTDRNKVYEIVSKMLDEPDQYGIYPTTRAYNELEALLTAIRTEAVGYTLAYVCDQMDKGRDPRTLEAPAVLESATSALNREWKPVVGSGLPSLP